MRYPNKTDEYRRPLKIVCAVALSIALVLSIVGLVMFLDRKKADNRDEVYLPIVSEGVVTDWGNVIDIVIKSRYIGGKVKTTKIDISDMSYTARQSNYYTETVKLPASIEEITLDSFDVFCVLKSIKVSIFNKHYKSVDGVLYSKDGKTLIRYPAGKEGESFTIPEGVETIAYNAFYRNTNLKTVYIPDGVTAIDEGAFRGCNSITEITLPDSVTFVGDFAFSRCEGLFRINLSKNLKTVGAQAFAHSTALKSIVLPDSLKELGKELFLGCWALSEIILPSGIEEIPEGMLSCCNSLTSFIVPDTVKKIGITAFDGAGLIRITLSEGLEVISWRAFEDCTSLREIVIPKSVRVLNGEVFQNCASLERVTFLGGDIRTSSGEFDGCTRLKSVYAPSIEDWLSISFGNRGANPLEFGAKLYLGGEFVTKIEIPDGTKVIGAYQFSGYSYLESVKLPEGLEEISNSAFENCNKIKEITLPSSLTLIDNAAFSGCASLENLYIPSLEFYLNLDGYGSIMSNVKNLYVDGERVTEVVFPEGVERIPDYAFCNWSFLESIYIPSSVNGIRYYGLAGCDSLTEIRFGGTVAEWEEIVRWSHYWKESSDNYTVICVDGTIEY